MTQLKRESNPSPGFPAGFLPQHLGSNGQFLVTGTGNPLPTRDSQLYTEIRTLKEEVQSLRTIINQLNNKPSSYVGYSNESKPSNVIKASSFYELDTGEAYLYDGSNWVVI
jgi:hypothetical protein